MFARNTWICKQAVVTLEEDLDWGLFEFEKQLLDRDLVWPGTSGTLSKFGRGSLGAIAEHAKGKINWLANARRALSHEEFLMVLAAQASFWAPDKFGMPAWQRIVPAAMTALRGRDTAFNERLAREGSDWPAFISAAPSIITSDLPAVERALLNEPYKLGAEVLDWLAASWVLKVRIAD